MRGKGSGARGPKPWPAAAAKGVDRVDRAGSVRWAAPVLVLAVVAVSFSAIFIRLAASPPLVTGAARLLIAGLAGTPFALAGYRRTPAPTRRDWRWGAVAWASLTVHYAAWIPSLSFTSVAAATVLVNLQPLPVFALERWLLGRRVRPVTLLGAAVALAGVVLLTGSGLATGGVRPFMGDLLAAAGAMGTAGYVLAGEIVRRRVPVLPYTSALYLASGAALALLAAGFAEPWPRLGSSAYVWFAALAAVPTLMGHTLVNAVLRHFKASAISVALLGEPVVAAFLAWRILGQRPDLGTVAGGAITLAGLALALLTAGARIPPPDPAAAA
jgi:drug/metabolite transporter (DMT)-like permease